LRILSEEVFLPLDIGHFITGSKWLDVVCFSLVFVGWFLFFDFLAVPFLNALSAKYKLLDFGLNHMAMTKGFSIALNTSHSIVP